MGVSSPAPPLPASKVSTRSLVNMAPSETIQMGGKYEWLGDSCLLESNGMMEYKCAYVVTISLDDFWGCFSKNVLNWKNFLKWKIATIEEKKKTSENPRSMRSGLWVPHVKRFRLAGALSRGRVVGAINMFGKEHGRIQLYEKSAPRGGEHIWNPPC